MRTTIFMWVVLVVAALTPSARADLDSSDPPVVPTLSLGLGGFFPMSPRPDPHVIGSALLGVQARLTSVEGRRVSLLAELGYSGDRRGYLAGRHLVVGTGIRYGNLFGGALLLQAAIGRTLGGASFGVRAGVRLDLRNYLGVIVLYESRHVFSGPDADVVGSGLRFEVFFDPLRFGRAMASIGHAIN